MKAQLSIEMLLSFLASCSFVLLLAMVLSAHSREAIRLSDQEQAIASASSAARAAEAAIRSGCVMSFPLGETADGGAGNGSGMAGSIPYRIDNGRFHTYKDGRILESGGVFDGSYAEPV